MYDIIYLILGDLVRFVIMDLSNHTYKTRMGVGGCLGYGWG